MPRIFVGRSWQDARDLLAELDRHVRPDGVYFEQTSYYHRYTADFYTHFYLLAKANATQLGDIVKEKLTLLLDHLMYITRPDGTTPFFGDDDGGKLLKFDDRPANDFRAALSNGAALSRDLTTNTLPEAVAEDTLWLLGQRGLENFDRIERRRPPHVARFRRGGYYLMRDGWTSESTTC